ncbi:homeobox protein knotted-1-like 3 isoform X1 [Arachis stenosperma]|uniref:homeobox protein knotted-1-like 3 isoform X1 n=1 Tax=Arachis stenosperma TaxID=217475 RepID=UPI0025AC8F2B|nr:homeobox protein knotted-1-like 3 isoform X1 [Arachis stenosperma]
MAYHNHHLSQDLSPLHHQHFSDQQQPQPLSDNTAILSDHLSPTDPTAKSPSDPHPNWLNNALLRTHYTNNDTNATNFLNLHTAASASDSSAAAAAAASQSSAQWLARPVLHRNHSEVIDDVAPLSNNESPDMKVAGDGKGEVATVESGGEGGGGLVNWQNARYKAEILSHPLYEQLLSAHVACLRIATPVDQLPRIDAQLAQSQNVVAKYSSFAHAPLGDDKELDQFLSHYVLLLCSFKEQLQQHVRVHAMEAVMACWEIEQSLQSLTGVSPGEGTGATMSDDEDDQVDSDANLFDGGLDGSDSMGFGPLVPTENERSLMERVRHELKHELKQGYKDKIVDIREEILRKRRAGKLPGDTTSVLKAWWQSHSKWPYPTEEDKARLVQETGLQLKQINNWFINQRKRNWHSNPSTSTSLKSKRKSAE